MMNGTDIAYDVWYTVKDNNKVKISEPLMLVLINDALSAVTAGLNGSSSNALYCGTVITLTDGVGDLPRDYDRFIDIYGGTVDSPSSRLEERVNGQLLDSHNFRIRGGKIYSGNDNVYLQYKRRVPTLDELNTQIELPEWTRRHIKNMVVHFYRSGGSGEAEPAIQGEVALIGRGLSRRERTGRLSRLAFTI